jgi:hypothetical protein
MAAANRSLATALWEARFASGLLRRCYTTSRDTTASPSPEGARNGPPDVALFRPPCGV